MAHVPLPQIAARLDKAHFVRRAQHLVRQAQAGYPFVSPGEVATASRRLRRVQKWLAPGFFRAAAGVWEWEEEGNDDD